MAIANAGVHWTGTLDSTPLERIEREIEINLLGVVRTAHAVLPQIVERRGYLLNIASLAAASHAPMMSAYAASKAGVEAFTDSIRVELAESGARVGLRLLRRDRDRHGPRRVRRPRGRAGQGADAGVRAPGRRRLDDGDRRDRGRRAVAPRARVGAALRRPERCCCGGILQPLTEIRALRSRAVRESLAIARARDEADAPSLVGDRAGLPS